MPTTRSQLTPATPHHVAGVRGVDHLAVADVHRHVTDRVVEEEQVARLGVALAHVGQRRRTAGGTGAAGRHRPGPTPTPSGPSSRRRRPGWPWRSGRRRRAGSSRQRRRRRHPGRARARWPPARGRRRLRRRRPGVVPPSASAAHRVALAGVAAACWRARAAARSRLRPPVLLLDQQRGQLALDLALEVVGLLDRGLDLRLLVGRATSAASASAPAWTRAPARSCVASWLTVSSSSIFETDEPRTSSVYCSRCAATAGASAPPRTAATPSPCTP